MIKKILWQIIIFLVTKENINTKFTILNFYLDCKVWQLKVEYSTYILRFWCKIMLLNMENLVKMPGLMYPKNILFYFRKYFRKSFSLNFFQSNHFISD